MDLKLKGRPLAGPSLLNAMKAPNRALLHLAASAAFIAMSQNHIEASTEAKFSNIVNDERLRVCASSAIPTCNKDFDRPIVLAEWLDAEEERAIAIEKTGDEKAARDLRIQILSYAAMLDIWMEQIRLFIARIDNANRDRGPASCPQQTIF